MSRAIQTLAALAILTLSLSACSGSSGSHQLDAFVVPATLTVDNSEPEEIDVYLDYAYVGTVFPYERVSFIVNPGSYRLSLDFIGDNEGLIDYTRVSMSSDTEVIVEVDRGLIGFLIDLIFD